MGVVGSTLLHVAAALAAQHRICRRRFQTGSGDFRSIGSVVPGDRHCRSGGGKPMARATGPPGIRWRKIRPAGHNHHGGSFGGPCVVVAGQHGVVGRARAADCCQPFASSRGNLNWRLLQMIVMALFFPLCGRNAIVWGWPIAASFQATLAWFAVYRARAAPAAATFHELSARIRIKLGRSRE
jgi:hypothetical protein